jgi:hypothetical protein
MPRAAIRPQSYTFEKKNGNFYENINAKKIFLRIATYPPEQAHLFLKSFNAYLCTQMSSNPKKAGNGEKIVRPESGARTIRRNSQNIHSKTRYFAPDLAEVAKKIRTSRGQPPPNPRKYRAI